MRISASVRAWIPTGREVLLQGPLTLTIGGGATLSATFTASIVSNAPDGSYRLIGRVENASDTFDEDQVLYEVN